MLSFAGDTFVFNFEEILASCSPLFTVLCYAKLS